MTGLKIKRMDNPISVVRTISLLLYRKAIFCVNIPSTYSVRLIVEKCSNRVFLWVIVGTYRISGSKEVWYAHIIYK
jgi:hypothetical protein